ncbi:hypothetical protein AAZV13_10G081400 [Glycine max]
MAAPFSFIGAIGSGKIKWRIKVRVICLWTLLEYHKQNEIDSLEMIFIDEKANKQNHISFCGKIHASIKKAYIPKFQKVFNEGSAYFIKYFLLNFMEDTKCVPIDANEIPKYQFDFIDFKYILSIVKEDLFADVIGHVIEKDSLIEFDKNGEKIKHIK